MPLPDFIIAGFPRCGTTFLKRSLQQHSRIFLPDPEINFFKNISRMPLERYESYFEIGKINGEKSPSYARSRRGMRRMSRLIPGVKIIVALRYPIQALHAFYSLRARQFYNDKKYAIDPVRHSFEDVVIKNRFPLYYLSPARTIPMDFFDYAGYLRNNIFPFFNRDQVLILIQEKMKNNPRQSLSDLFDFIGVENEDVEIKENQNYNEAFQYPHINYSGRKYKQTISGLLEYYRPQNEELYSYFGGSIPEWREIEAYYENLT